MMDDQLRSVVNYGASRGFHVRTHTLAAAPSVWPKWARRLGVSGRADLLKSRAFIPRAEVAYTPDADPLLVAWCLLHEIGHCEQAADLGDKGAIGEDAVAYKCNPLHKWEVECDAWARAIVMGDALGVPMTAEVADSILALLSSYMNDAEVAEVTATYAYLWSI